MMQADFNDFSIKEVEEKGKDAAGGHKYRASKSLAEKAAWSYCKAHDIPLVTINPPLIFGPILHQVDKPENLNTSVANFYKVVNGETKEEDLPGGGGNWIDVREGAFLPSLSYPLVLSCLLTYEPLSLDLTVSEAHVLALTVPQAANNRYIISAGPFATQQFTDFLHSYAPELKNIPTGKKGAIEEANDPQNVLISSGAKAEKELGIVYRPFDDSAKDMYESIKARGW